MTTLVFIYDEDGYISETVEPLIYGQSHVFRKFSKSATELTICKILMKNPHRNCISIYNVSGSYIDMEFVDTKRRLNLMKHKNNVMTDIKKAIRHLHSFNIVYIDLKFDNIGYNKKEQCHKLFDFDMSGIISSKNNTEWLFKPESGYVYRDFFNTMPFADCQDFKNIDAFALHKFEETFI